MQRIIPRIKYLISDFDGTLVNSMPLYTNCFVQTMSNIVPHSEQLKRFYQETAGQSLTSQIKTAAQKFSNIIIDDTTPLEAQFFKHYQTYSEIEVMQGAKETLKKLKNNDIKITVWSGTRTDILGQKLQQAKLSPFVDYYLGNVPGDSKLVKGPILFKQIAAYFNISVDQLKHEALVIGDGIGDIEAGQKCGVKTIGLGENREQLRKAGADYIIESITDLPHLLE